MFCSFAEAQTDFYGSLDDVHSLRLTLPEDGPHAQLWLGSATREIALSGSCEKSSCLYSGVDTAVTLRFFRTVDERVMGSVTFGDGRQQSLAAMAYDGPSEHLELSLEEAPRRSVPASFTQLLRSRLRSSRAERADSMLQAYSEEVFAPNFLISCGSDKMGERLDHRRR